MQDLLALSHVMDLHPLTEVHTRQELQVALGAKVPIVGINNRDLKSFQVSLETTFTLLADIPREVVVVSESGIRTHADLVKLGSAGARAVLLVLQGMDTSGKGGVIRQVAGLVNPQGLTISSFKKPTAEERAHHFLWRVRPRVPAPGQIGVFDRSHYEDVLIARVDSLVPEDVWRGRYAEITAFESELVEPTECGRRFEVRDPRATGCGIRSHREPLP